MSATAQTFDVLDELDRLADFAESSNRVATRLAWSGGFSIDSPVTDELNDPALHLLWEFGNGGMVGAEEAIAELRAAVKVAREARDA